MWLSDPGVVVIYSVKLVVIVHLMLSMCLSDPGVVVVYSLKRVVIVLHDVEHVTVVAAFITSISSRALLPTNMKSFWRLF